MSFFSILLSFWAISPFLPTAIPRKPGSTMNMILSSASMQSFRLAPVARWKNPM
jgi:hypothetical protein